jgi:hypothetical protein
MSRSVRPLFGVPTVALIRRIVEWKGHEVPLAQIGMELEFRRGRTVQFLRSLVARELEVCSRPFSESVSREMLRSQSLEYILRQEAGEILRGVRLLKAAGYSVASDEQSLTHRIKAMKRAIAWDDGSALSAEAGEPNSSERYRLLITVFSRALARASALGFSEKGAATRRWRALRSVLVRNCQMHARGTRNG